MYFKSQKLQEYISELWDCDKNNRQKLTKEESIKLKGIIIQDNLNFFRDVLMDKFFLNNLFVFYVSQTMILLDDKKTKFEKGLLNIWDEILTRVNHCNFEEWIDQIFNEKEFEMLTPEEHRSFEIEREIDDAEFVKSRI